MLPESRQPQIQDTTVEIRPASPKYRTLLLKCAQQAPNTKDHCSKTAIKPQKQDTTLLFKYASTPNAAHYCSNKAKQEQAQETVVEIGPTDHYCIRIPLEYG